MKKLMMLCLTAAMLMAPLAANAAVRVHVGPRFVAPRVYAPRYIGPRYIGPAYVGPRVGVGWGPYWAPAYPPYYWEPYEYSYGYTNSAPSTGALKFDTKDKDAQVYVDGALAGTVGNLKTMDLQPGTYNIEVRAPEGPDFEQKVYIAAGQTLHLNPDLMPAEPQGQQ